MAESCFPYLDDAGAEAHLINLGTYATNSEKVSQLVISLEDHANMVGASKETVICTLANFKD